MWNPGQGIQSSYGLLLGLENPRKRFLDAITILRNNHPNNDTIDLSGLGTFLLKLTILEKVDFISALAKSKYVHCLKLNNTTLDKQLFENLSDAIKNNNIISVSYNCDQSGSDQTLRTVLVEKQSGFINKEISFNPEKSVPDEKLDRMTVLLQHEWARLNKYSMKPAPDFDLEKAYLGSFDNLNLLYNFIIHRPKELNKKLFNTKKTLLSSLVAACRFEALKLVLSLTKQSLELPIDWENQKSNALEDAIYNSDLLSTRILLAFGTNPNLEDENGIAPLHFLLTNDRIYEKDFIDILNLLFQNGFYSTIKDEVDHLPILINKKWRSIFTSFINDYQQLTSVGKTLKDEKFHNHHSILFGISNKIISNILRQTLGQGSFINEETREKISYTVLNK